MKPYENNAEVLTLDGFTVENGLDAVTLSGSMDLTRDRRSLRAAMALRACLDGVISVLEASDLPEVAEPAPGNVQRKANPLKT